MLSYEPSCIDRIHEASSTLNTIDEMAMIVRRLFRHRFRQARMMLVVMVVELSLLSLLSLLLLFEKRKRFLEIYR
jgi:hypothetical protein